MQNVLVTGASGMIGRKLTSFLIENGFNVYALSRSPRATPSLKTLHWICNLNELNNTRIDHIINLAGSSLHKDFWDNKTKLKALDSRLNSLDDIYFWLSQLDYIPESIFIPSSVGFYGVCPNQQWDSYITEDYHPQPIFISELHQRYEHRAIELFGPKVNILRLGHVFSDNGGILPKLLKPIQLGIYGVIDDGNSPIPWVHIDDVCNAIGFLIQNPSDCRVFNIVAPYPTNQRSFSETAESYFNKKTFFKNIPRWALRISLGEQADLYIDGMHCYPKAILNKGFEFKHTYFIDTLKNLYPSHDNMK